MLHLLALYLVLMDDANMDSKTMMELKKLSESSYFVINNLSESIKVLATTKTDSPYFDSAMQRIIKANKEADELLEKQQMMIRKLR